MEGKNIVIEHRAAEGKYERLPGFAAELVQMRVDVIVAPSPVAIRAAQQATSTIPIVMLTNPDPVGSGFVASLARPGSNITGLSSINIDLSSKYVELLRAAVPNLSQATVLLNPGTPIHPDVFKRIQVVALANGVKISPARASAENDLEPAFAAMKQERAGALIVLGDPFLFSQTRRIVEFAAKHRLPSISVRREFVEAGGLMSYGQNNAEHYYRAATYVDKILRGTKPGDLPVEQPTKVELVINLNTAKAIGLTIPPELLLRVDKVIE